MKKSTKILIPGGAGLVGQNLIPRLKERGYTNLVVIDKHQRNLDTLRKLHPNILAEYADLAESGEWENYFEAADVVVMLQAQIGGPTLEPFIRNNITATRKIINVMKRYATPYLVHLSSSVVVSLADDDYSNTKREQEKIILASGITNIVLRPTLMFGWFDRKHLGWLSRFMQKTPIFPIPGDGHYMRQPLYVGDFCNIIISCIESQIAGETFNISGLEKVDYIDIIRSIKRAVKSRTVILHIPYHLFSILLKTWSLFDNNPPFTAAQLAALVGKDEFEVIDWPIFFDVEPTPFDEAIRQTYLHPIYSNVILEF